MLKKFFALNELTPKRSSEISIRFYPNFIPSHKDEPSRDKFEIVYNDEFGHGVRSKVSFGTGELLFRFDGILLNEQTLYSLQKKPGLYIEDPYLMGKVLHSCDPNTSVDTRIQEFRARREINPGDLITMDYESTEDELFRSFECKCGAANCRGHIKGRLIM